MRRKNGSVSWSVVALAAMVMIVVVLAVAVVSAVGRAFDLAEYRATDPYHQSLALRDQVIDNGRRDGRLLWALGGIVVVGGAVVFMYFGAPFLKEARLGYKAVRPRREQIRRRPTGPQDWPSGGLSPLPVAPRMRLIQDGNQPQTAEYEELETVDTWSG